MNALLQVISTGGSDAVRTGRLEANVGPGFLKDRPMAVHVATFKRMHTDMGAPVLRSGEQIGMEDYFLHVYASIDRKPYRLMMQLRTSDALIGPLGEEYDD